MNKIFCKYTNKYLFIFLIIIITLISQNFSEINLGGDGSRFSLIFPDIFFNNLSLNFYSFDNVQQYPNQIGSIYQNLSRILFQNIFFQKFNILTDYIFIGLGSYIGAFLILKDHTHKVNLTLLTLPLIYAFSPSWAWGVYNNGGPWIYIFAMLPLVLRFFFNFVIKGDNFSLLIALIISFIYSEISSLRHIQWSVPLAALIFLIYLPKFLLNYKKSLKNFFLLIILIIVLNLHLFLSVYLNFFSEFTSINLFRYNVDQRVIEFKNFINEATNIYHYLFSSLKFGETLFSVSKSLLKIQNLVMGVILLFIIVLTFIFRIKLNNIIKYHIGLFILYFILVNLGFNELTRFIFIELVDNYSFMHGFKSNTKFLSAYNLIYTLIIFQILKHCEDIYKIKTCIISFFLTLIIILPTINWLANDQKNYPYYDNSNFNNYNESYIQLMQKIKTEEELHHQGNILILPITYEYEFILGENNKFYIGPNVSSTLTGTKSFTGNYYETDYNRHFGNKMFNNFFNNFERLIMKNDISQLSKLFKDYNIHYLVINESDQLLKYENYFQNLNFFIKNKKKIIKILKEIGFEKNLNNFGKYSLYIKNNKENCLQINILRSSIFKFSDQCNNAQKNIKEFMEKNNIRENELFFADNISFISKEIKIINPFSLKNKNKNSNIFYVVYKSQLIIEFGFMISFIIYLIVIMFMTFIIIKNEK